MKTMCIYFRMLILTILLLSISSINVFSEMHDDPIKILFELNAWLEDFYSELQKGEIHHLNVRREIVVMKGCICDWSCKTSYVVNSAKNCSIRPESIDYLEEALKESIKKLARDFGSFSFHQKVLKTSERNERAIQSQLDKLSFFWHPFNDVKEFAERSTKDQKQITKIQNREERNRYQENCRIKSLRAVNYQNELLSSLNKIDNTLYRILLTMSR